MEIRSGDMHARGGSPDGTRRNIPENDIVNALLELAETPAHVRLHQQRVTEAASRIGRLVAPYIPVDLPLLVAAAGLHDITKAQPGHAEKGAALLERKGFPEVAKIIREHMDLSETPSVEAEILYLADKYVHDTQVEPLEEREKQVRKKFSDDRDALKSAIRRMDRAKDIERQIEKITGLSPLFEHIFCAPE